MENSQNKNRILVILIVILTFVLVIGISYAYYDSNIRKTGDFKSNLQSGVDSSIYIVEGTTDVIENLIPGEHITHTFSVVNDGDVELCYTLEWTDIVNTFENKDDLIVTLTRDGIEVPLVLDVFPAFNSTLATNLHIQAYETQNYVLTVTYRDVIGKQQKGDKGKKFKASIIGEVISCDVRYNEAPEKSLASLYKHNFSIETSSSSCPSFDKNTKEIFINSYYTLKTMCEAEDNFGKTYYFRGNVEDNYVEFAGFIWRIVRINGDGSYRLIYDGTVAYDNSSTSEDRQIGTSAFNAVSDDNAYVGYMYKAINQSSYVNTFDVMNNKNAYSSTIKTYIDDWYVNHIDIPINNGNTKKYSDYVSNNTIFCNDKNIYIGSGYGTSSTNYRWSVEAGHNISTTSSFFCKNSNGTVDLLNDSYSVSDNGNASLIYPVGLITTDEVVAAGGYFEGNTQYYLYSGMNYWTMSSDCFSDTSRVLFVTSTGALGRDVVSNSYGVRPVISLKASIVFENGSRGTKNNPLKVVYE